MYAWELNSKMKRIVATELVIFDLFNLLIGGTLVWATAGSAKTLANMYPSP
jgi:hypothetical protein